MVSVMEKLCLKLAEPMSVWTFEVFVSTDAKRFCVSIDPDGDHLVLFEPELTDVVLIKKWTKAGPVPEGTMNPLFFLANVFPYGGRDGDEPRLTYLTDVKWPILAGLQPLPKTNEHNHLGWYFRSTDGWIVRYGTQVQIEPKNPVYFWVIQNEPEYGELIVEAYRRLKEVGLDVLPHKPDWPFLDELLQFVQKQQVEEFETAKQLAAGIWAETMSKEGGKSGALIALLRSKDGPTNRTAHQLLDVIKPLFEALGVNTDELKKLPPGTLDAGRD